MFGLSPGPSRDPVDRIALNMLMFSGASTRNPHRNPNPYTQRQVTSREEKIAEDFYMEEREESSLVQGPDGLRIVPDDL